MYLPFISLVVALAAVVTYGIFCLIMAMLGTIVTEQVGK